MFNRNFLKQLSFCVLGASSVSLMQSSVGFTANNLDLATNSEALKGSVSNVDSVGKNSRSTKECGEKVRAELQKKKACTTLEECLVRGIHDKKFEGFLGKISLVLSIPDMILDYLNLKVAELLQLNEWPEILAISVRAIFLALFFVLVYFPYVLLLFISFVGLKHLGQKFKEGIGKLVDIANINQNKVEGGNAV